MKIEDLKKIRDIIDKEIIKMEKNAEAQRKFVAKKRGENMDKFTLELQTEGDGKICEGKSLQDMLDEIKHQIKMGLFEKDDVYLIRKNGEIIAEYNYEQAQRI